MKTTDLFPSKYVKASDLEDGPKTVVMRELVVEEIGQGKSAEPKGVLYFSDFDKGMVLNVTNCRTIEDGYGTETDAWPGKPIELFSMKVDFKGDRVDAVRVRIPKPPSADELIDPQEPPPSSGSGPVDLDDEIPFAPVRDLP